MKSGDFLSMAARTRVWRPKLARLGTVNWLLTIEFIRAMLNLVSSSLIPEHQIINNQIPFSFVKVKVFTPADRAGLRDGDYLCSINGNDVFEMSHKGICEAIIKSSSKMEVVVERYKQQKYWNLLWSTNLHFLYFFRPRESANLFTCGN